MTSGSILLLRRASSLQEDEEEKNKATALRTTYLVVCYDQTILSGAYLSDSSETDLRSYIARYQASYSRGLRLQCDSVIL
jgi:hypothetical protein